MGTAYIALFNYVFAKREGGQFILRIEDTDRARSSIESEEAILRALKWVGLSWDEGPDIGGPYGPYRQSERGAHYRTAADELVEKGKAYPCFCTEARLEAMKAAARAEKRSGGYDRSCRALPADEARARMAAGEPHTVRLAMPLGGVTRFTDTVRGDLEFDNTTIDDQILLKSDGFPTYHLANVVDDHLMRISHVIRAEEWISSTPKHVQLYAAFGWQAPVWTHMSLLRNPDKSKISKRKTPVSLDYYRDAGFLPEALLNFLGNMGFSFGGDREHYTLSEMVEVFDFSRVSAGGPVFDLLKLTNLNGHYIRALSPAALLARLRDWRLSDEFLARLIPLAHERIERLDQFLPTTDFFFSGDLDYARISDEIVPKGRDAKTTSAALHELVETLDNVRPWRQDKLEATVRAFCETSGWKSKELFSAIRVGMTGRAASPPLFDTMAVLGRELFRRRLRGVAEALARKAS